MPGALVDLRADIDLLPCHVNQRYHRYAIKDRPDTQDGDTNDIDIDDYSSLESGSSSSHTIRSQVDNVNEAAESAADMDVVYDTVIRLTRGTQGVAIEDVARESGFTRIEVQGSIALWDSMGVITRRPGDEVGFASEGMRL